MSRQALELALEALERGETELRWKAITAIKEALAQPEQEPVGKFAKFTDGIWREVTDGSAGVPLYTTPPQRTWVGLTDEEIKEGESKGELGHGFIQGALWAEATLKEKNA